MDKKLRFCLIGRGSIGTRHLKNLKFLGYNDIIAFSRSNNPAKDKEYLDTYQVKTLSSLEEVKNYQPDAFIIANPTSEHIEAANLALDMDAHIFMEKPLAHNLDGTSEFKEKLAKKNKIFLQANCLRFHPVIKKIKEMIDSGDFGKIYFSRIQVGQYLPDWHPDEDYKISYAGRKDLGGGVVLTLQHEIDYAYWFFGKFNKIKSLVRKVSDLEIDTEDVASIIAESAKGQLVEIHMDYLQRPGGRTIHIQGSTGSVDYKFGDEVMEFFDAEKKVAKPIFELKDYDSNQMYIDELKHFIDCLSGDSQPLVNIDDAVYTLEACLKIKEQGA